MEDGVVWVLGEGGGRAEFGGRFADGGPDGGVCVFEVAGVADCGEEEVVGEEFHGGDFDVFLETV